MCTVWRALRERRSLLKENVLKKVPVGVELEDNELLTLIEEEIQGMQQDGYLRLKRKSSYVIWCSMLCGGWTYYRICWMMKR